MLRVNSVWNLGLALREARERRHLTQAQAAAQLGVPVRTWQSWETGEVVPQTRRWWLLMDWLGTPVVNSPARCRIPAHSRTGPTEGKGNR